MCIRDSYRTLFPALERTKKGSEMCAIAEKAGELLGMHIEEAFEPTATDANWFCYFGVPAIDALGPLNYGIHTTEEKVYIPVSYTHLDVYKRQVYRIDT